MKRIFFIITLVLVLSLTLISTPALATADFGLKDTAGAAGLGEYNKSVPELVGNIIGTALSLVAVLFFVITVYGGILWMTARGKEDQSKKALDTIVAAVIGIIIVLGAYALTNLVFDSLKGGRTTTDINSGPTITNLGLDQRGDGDGDGDGGQQLPSEENWLACNWVFVDENNDAREHRGCVIVESQQSTREGWQQDCEPPTFIDIRTNVDLDFDEEDDWDAGEGDSIVAVRNGTEDGARSICDLLVN